jgi:hypothetical protein
MLDHFDAVTAAVANLDGLLAHSSDHARNAALSEISQRVPEQLRCATGWQIDRCSGAHVSAMLWSIAEAAQGAKRDVIASGQEGFRRHSAWRDFVWELADWAEGHGLRVSAAKSKSTEKPGSNRDWPSQFVQFVKRLQSRLAPNWLSISQLEFHSTDDAIRGAVASVLAKRRRHLAPRKFAG